MKNRSTARALLGALTAMGIACAHAPAPVAAKASRVEPIFVTGSHIAQRMDLASSALPTISPLRLYSREQIGGTGRGYDLGAALTAMDPSLY